MKKVYLAIGLGALAFGFYSYYTKQFDILYNFKYKLKGIKILSSTFSKINLQLTYEVVNDSAISLTITQYDFDVKINGEKVANVKNASVNQFLQKDGGKSIFTIDVGISTANLLMSNVSLGLIEDFKNSTITLDGSFGIKKGLFSWNKLPYKFTYKVKDFL
jgi:LEA14-like dessication related protein